VPEPVYAAGGFGPGVMPNMGGGLGPMIQTHAGEGALVVPRSQMSGSGGGFIGALEGMASGGGASSGGDSSYTSAGGLNITNVIHADGNVDLAAVKRAAYEGTLEALDRGDPQMMTSIRERLGL
jgi:hypothetical protein